MKARPIILAAGGTGGHMFPAEALARALLNRGEQVVLITDSRGGAFGDSLPEVEVKRIRSASPSGSMAKVVRGVLDLLAGWSEARGLLIDYDPVAVVGFGGYASLPTVFAAQRRRIPTVIHEQNAVLGRANRLLLYRAKIVATAFDDVVGVWPSAARLTAKTGIPVRPAIMEVAEAPYQPATADGPFNLLVTGGSQGAAVFSELIPAAVATLPAEQRARLRIAQQVRPELMERTKAAYANTGVQVELQTFFKDMPQRLTNCHLAVCRAGASTVAELATVGRPAFYIPLPFATDDHQTANADAMVKIGAGWSFSQFNLTPQLLASRLSKAMGKPELLAKAAAAAATQSRLQVFAAELLADAVQAAAALVRPEDPAVKEVAA